MAAIALDRRFPPASATARVLPLLLRWPAVHIDLVLLGFVLLLGGLLRAAFLLRAPMFIIADSENYFLPGFQLAQGAGFDLEARRAPVYPLFIAAVVRWVGQDLAALALAQHALGLATIALTFGIARITFGRVAALLAGLLVALNGSLLVSEHTVGTEALSIPLLTAAAAAGVLGVRDRRARVLALAGVLLGLTVLTRSVALGLLPGVPLVLAALRPGWRRWLTLSAVYLLGVAAVLLPWMVRNYVTLNVFSTEGAFGQTLVGRTVRHDRFVFVEPGALPSGGAAVDGRQRARELMQEAANRGSFITPLRRRVMQELGLSELDANRLMRDLAVEAVARQPGYYAIGTARFFVMLAMGWPERLRDAWQSRREAESREEWESHPSIAPLLGPPSPIHERQFAEADRLASLFQPGRYGAPLLALFAVGALAALLGPTTVRPALLAVLWTIALLGVGVAFVGPVLRYRYPAEPFLAVLAAGGATTLIELAARALERVRSARQASPSVS